MYSPNAPSHKPAHCAAADWRVAVEAAVQGAKLRASSARTAMLDWIAAAERSFTAETIVQQLVIGWGLGSRPTVYRTVDWLRAAGWLARLHVEGSDRAYVRSLPGGHQLLCTGCGAIQTIAGLDPTPLLEAHLRTLGFELCGQHPELYGRCPLCRMAPAAHTTYIDKESYL